MRTKFLLSGVVLRSKILWVQQHSVKHDVFVFFLFIMLCVKVDRTMMTVKASSMHLNCRIWQFIIKDMQYVLAILCMQVILYAEAELLKAQSQYLILAIDFAPKEPPSLYICTTSFLTCQECQ